MTVTWDDSLDAVFAGDLTAGLGYRTPAGGVVVQAVAPIGLRDRARGTLGFTTSLGFSKKLDRLAADPRVVLAFHAREHGRASSARYLLAQGTARVVDRPTETERDRVRTLAAERLGAPKRGRFWDYWLREYYVTRVPVEVSVTRIQCWPTLDAAGTPELVLGEPLPAPPPASQSPPGRGTAPRIDVARAARRLRRAGLTGHTYRAQLIGLETRQHTGWLEVSPAGARYAPHTEVGYRAPANKTFLLLLNGALAKRGVRQARGGAR